jgi:hypothetical protein
MVCFRHTGAARHSAISPINRPQPTQTSRSSRQMPRQGDAGSVNGVVIDSAATGTLVKMQASKSGSFAPRGDMTMRANRTGWAIGLSLMLGASVSGCATTPEGTAESLAFTDGLIRDYNLSDAHKRRLQYYVSDRITLVRAASNNLRGIADGKLIERGNTTVRGLEIAAGTPGVLVGSGPNWVAVSFEPGSYLYFVSQQAPVNSPYWQDRRGDDRYYLYAPDWDGRAGTVRVGNSSYQAVDGSIESYLIVDREALFDANSSSATLSGRWLEGTQRRF